MRVAVVAEETAQHEETDAAMRIRRLAERLSARRNDVTVYCSRWWTDDAHRIDRNDVTYHAVTRDVDVPDRRFVTRLPGALREYDPTVIHAVHTNPAVVHGAKLASLYTRAPLLVDWYDPVGGNGWRRRAVRMAATVPDLVVTPSRTVQTAVRELGRAVSEITVIPDAIDIERIRETAAEPMGDLVYSRRLDEDANLESLLLALAELRELAWDAVVVGDGPARERYEQQAADLRIDDRVRFIGTQPLDRRIAIFRAAHVAVHTAYVAPFPTDFLWAIACGCVGIAEYHADSSAHELIERRTRGFRVTGEEELADAILSAADLERRDVDEDFATFDEDTQLERYLDCYRSLGAL